MTPETRKFYDDMFDLFGTQGWMNFVQSCSSELDAIKENIFDVASNEELHYHKGQVNVLKRIVGLEQYIRATYEQTVNSEEALDDSE